MFGGNGGIFYKKKIKVLSNRTEKTGKRKGKLPKDLENHGELHWFFFFFSQKAQNSAAYNILILWNNVWLFKGRRRFSMGRTLLDGTEVLILLRNKENSYLFWNEWGCLPQEGFETWLEWDITVCRGVYFTNLKSVKPVNILTGSLNHIW